MRIRERRLQRTGAVDARRDGEMIEVEAPSEAEWWRRGLDAVPGKIVPRFPTAV
jgi:hypothetical protein